MFRFEHPAYFWLVAVTLIVAASLLFRRHLMTNDLARWGSKKTAARLTEAFSKIPSLTWLIIGAFLLLNLAAVNPQWGFKTRSVEYQSADVYILLDISNSMLAEDIAPNRLERAKRFALDMANAFKSDRIGLVVFAGHAYMQSPLTTDWNAIQLYLNAAHPDQAGTQGTSIGEAIKLAVSSRSEGVEGQGALIVITDGEDHDSDAVTAMQEAVTRGWTSYIIGVGTEEGATIPVVIDKRMDVKRDETGQPVVTKINRQLMMDLAQQGNGKYFDIDQGMTIVTALKEELAGLERSQQEKRSFSEHRSYFQWFIIGALFLFMLVVAIRYKHDVI